MRYTRPLLWMAAIAVLLTAVALATWSDGGPGEQPPPQPWERPLVVRDLPEIAADTLRVLVLPDPLTWEERPKAVSGLEWELLQRFARQAGLALVAVPVQHPDSMLMALQRGEGDIIAAQWSPTKASRNWLRATAPYRQVRPVLAVLRSDPLAVPTRRGTATVDAAVDTVWISAWSPFAQQPDRVLGSGRQLPLVHDDPHITPEDLLMELVIGRHAATIITDARAEHEAGRFPVLEFTELPGAARPLCFGVRSNAPALLRALNTWLADPAEVEARAQYIKAYTGRMPKPGPLATRKRIKVEGDSISPYDAHFRRHADDLPWDWELLAAIAYRESRFDSTVTSRMGATGIMQLMPRTAARLGVDTALGMQDQVRAATRYLNKLDTMWMRAVPDREQRLRFVLASYNAGPGHIIDAQRLAERLGLDPQRWEHHVERAILLKAKPRYFMLPEMRNGYCQGAQVFHFVRDVLALRRQLKARPKVPAAVVVEEAGEG